VIAILSSGRLVLLAQTAVGVVLAQQLGDHGRGAQEDCWGFFFSRIVIQIRA
jgi:hypothetical protein